MNRLYAVECALSNTGGVADHRLALRPSQIEPFVQALAAELEVPDAPKAGGELPEEARRWLEPLAKDLKRSCRQVHRPGRRRPARQRPRSRPRHQSHAEERRRRRSCTARRSRRGRSITAKQIAELVEEMAGRRVEMLVILGGNPVYTAPADLDIRRATEERAACASISGLYQDETAALCDWHIPEAHYLESWGDARAYDGTASIIQPLIAPLFGGRSAHELLAAFTESPERGGLDIVREHWRGWWKEQKQVRRLRDVLAAVAARGRYRGHDVHAAKAEAGGLGGSCRESSHQPAAPTREFEIVFRPDPTLFDGRFANNGWLQELPKPVTKLTWDNAALMSPKTAEKLGITYVHGILVSVQLHRRRARPRSCGRGRVELSRPQGQGARVDSARPRRRRDHPPPGPRPAARRPRRQRRRLQRLRPPHQRRPVVRQRPGSDASCRARNMRWPARRCTTTWRNAAPSVPRRWSTSSNIRASPTN